MTDETDQLEGQGETTEAADHPEIAAIVESLEPEGESPEVAEPDTEGGEAPEPVEPVAEPAEPTEPTEPTEPEPALEPALELAQSDQPVSSPDEVSWWPFVAYLALWLVFASVVIWRFYDIPQGQAVYESPLYPLSVFGGIALTVAGPLLSLATWVAAWGAPGSSKWGQFVSSLVKGSAVTAGGVVLWWLALVIVDQLRLGRVF